MLLHLTLTLVLTLGFVGIGIYWVRTAPKNSNIFDSRIIFRVCGWLLSIGLSVISALNFPIPKHEADSMLTPIALLLYILGAALAIWAKNTMSIHWGIPAQHDIKRQDKLLTTGPFALSRNPIYTGLLLMFVGYSLAIKSWFIFFALIYYWIILQGVKKEEILLEKYFGKKYLEYKKSVPRFFGIQNIK